MKGSASSAVMVRGHSSQVECSQVLDGTVYESRTTNACSLTPALPSTCMQTDFLQVKLFLQSHLAKSFSLCQYSILQRKHIYIFVQL